MVKTWTINARLIVFSLSLTWLTFVPVFSHAQNFSRPEASGLVSAAERPTEEALLQQNPNATLVGTGVSLESPLLVAQKESKPQTNKSKAVGKTGDKGSDASKKDDDEEDEDEEEDEEDEDKDNPPVTKGDNASEKKKAK